MKKIIALVRSNVRYLMNLGTTFLSQTISALSVLILTPILLHQLGTTEFALYGIILNVVVFSAVFDFGLNLGLLKRLIQKEPRLLELINSIFFLFIGCLFFSVLIFFFVFTNKIVDVADHILVFSLITGVLVAQNMIALFFDMLIQSANKIFLGRSIRVLKLLLELLLLILLTQLKSVVILFAGSIFVNSIYILALQYYSKKQIQYRISFQYFNSKLLLNHFKYSSWYFLNSIAIVLVFNTQIMLINRHASSESVAKYLLVTRFYDIIRMGIANFMLVLFPTIALVQSEGNWNEIRHIFFKALSRIFLMALVVMVLNFLFVKPYFLQWSKFKDSEMANLFILFGLFIFVIAIDNVSSTFLSALKFNRMPTIISIGQGIIGLTIGYFFLPIYGVAGVAVASLLALCCTSLLFNPAYLLFKIKRQLKYR